MMKWIILGVCLLTFTGSGCQSFKKFFSQTPGSEAKVEKQSNTQNSSFGADLNEVEQNYLNQIRQNNENMHLQNRKAVFGY